MIPEPDLSNWLNYSPDMRDFALFIAMLILLATIFIEPVRNGIRVFIANYVRVIGLSAIFVFIVFGLCFFALAAFFPNLLDDLARMIAAFYAQ